MAEQSPPSKTQLIESLRSSAADTVARLRSRPAEAFELGRYENGWNGRQILAHIASIEWTYPRLIDIAREAQAPGAAPSAVAEPPTRALRGGNDAYNERQVAKRAHLSAAELLAEFERNRAETFRAVETA